MQCPLQNNPLVINCDTYGRALVWWMCLQSNTCGATLCIWLLLTLTFRYYIESASKSFPTLPQLIQHYQTHSFTEYRAKTKTKVATKLSTPYREVTYQSWQETIADHPPPGPRRRVHAFIGVCLMIRRVSLLLVTTAQAYADGCLSPFTHCLTCHACTVCTGLDSALACLVLLRCGLRRVRTDVLLLVRVPIADHQLQRSMWVAFRLVQARSAVRHLYVGLLNRTVAVPSVLHVCASSYT